MDKLDHSMMKAYIDDSQSAYIRYEDTGGIEPLLQVIALSLQAIAVAVAANHLEDEYENF